MCNFFSFVTDPENFGGKRFYFNWDQRKERKFDSCDAHSTICKFYQLKEDQCNKYEYNPLTKEFLVDQTNSNVNDNVQAESWVKNLNFESIVKPLKVKPIINPFELPEIKEVTKEQIKLLKEWNSVGDSVRNSVWNSVWNSVRNSVGASVRNSVWNSVWNSVGDSVWNSVWNSVYCYVGSFINIKYDFDFTCVNKLWNMGLVASFDGKTWRLHSGKDAKIVFEISKIDLEKDN